MRQLFIYVLLFFTLPVLANIRLNEVMQANVTSVVDDLNRFPEGWVELYNSGAQPVSLKGYSISKKETKHFELPDTVLAPHGYLLVYCDKADSGMHASFQLPVNKAGAIFLLNGQKEVEDSVALQPVLAPNVSYSRLTDNSWHFVHTPTPNEDNDATLVDGVAAVPIFSVQGGVKTDTFSLKLLLPEGSPSDARLVYTLDGSEPVENSDVYWQPIPISRSTVVRARVLSNQMANSPAASQSYLFLNRQQTLPIVSLVTDSAYFLGNELGIYVRGTYGETHPNSTPKVAVFGRSNYYYDWNRPANIEYFPLNSDDAALNQWCELRVGGTTSRRLPVKSLVIKADKCYGENNFNYAFFPDKTNQTAVKSLMLRNSGQDAQYTFLRDAFMQLSFARHTAIDYQAYQPAMLFVNGRYFGLRNIRERSNNDYIKANYGLSDGYDLISSFKGRVEEGDSADFLKFRQIYSDSLSTYEQLDSLMDINEFLDYFVMNSVFCNTDFPGNNMLMWKPKAPNAKWRWIAKDMDFGMGRSSSPYDLQYLNFILRKEPFLNRKSFNAAWACALFKKMMSLPESRETFIDRASVYMGTFASPSRLIALLDSLSDNIEYEMPFFTEFRGKDEEDWQAALADCKSWLLKRIPFLYSDLSRFFEMGKSVPLLVESDNKLYFNNLPLEDGLFDGRYYEQRRIHLSADSLTEFRRTDFLQQQSPSAPMSRYTEWVGDCWQKGISQPESASDYKWQVQYIKGDSIITELYSDENLDWAIPAGATSVCINQGDCSGSPTAVLDNSQIVFEAYDFSGRIVAKGSYSQVVLQLKANKNYIISAFNGSKKITTLKWRRVN